MKTSHFCHQKHCIIHFHYKFVDVNANRKNCAIEIVITRQIEQHIFAACSKHDFSCFLQMSETNLLFFNVFVMLIIRQNVFLNITKVYVIQFNIFRQITKLTLDFETSKSHSYFIFEFRLFLFAQFSSTINFDFKNFLVDAFSSNKNQKSILICK